MGAPQTSMPYWVRRRIFQREIALSDFSGGLNLFAAPSEVANNETADALNVTLDERGGLQKRLGQAKWNGSVFGAAVKGLWEWKTGDAVLTQAGTSIYKGTSTSATHTFSTADLVCFAEFGTSVYVIHPVDGLFGSSDAVTWTAVTGAPVGSCLVPWQTSLLAAGDPGNPSRLYASALNDPLNWSVSAIRTGTDMGATNGSTTVTSATAAFTSADVGKQITIGTAGTYRIASITDATTAVLTSSYSGTTATGITWTMVGQGWTNDIRELDSKIITALLAAPGVDIAGKPGVLVFKDRSLYRVNDPGTGAYQTLSTTVGAANQKSVRGLHELIHFINATGTYATNGVAVPTLTSVKLQPLFQASQVNNAQTSALMCVGAKGDRVHFSLPRAGDTHNTLHLEFHPQQGWFMAHDDAASCYATTTIGDEQLLAGSPTVSGQVYEQLTGGTDDGADITCRYQTKWLEPGGGIDTRFRRLRVFGRGQFELYTKLDFDLGSGALANVNISSGQATWDASLWDESTWGDSVYEGAQDFWSLGKGNAIAFQFRETSGIVSQPAAILGVGTPPEQGAFAVYGLVLQFIPISI